MHKDEFYLVSHLVADHDYYADPDYCRLFDGTQFEEMKEFLKEKNAIYNKAFKDTGKGSFELDRKVAEANHQDIYAPIIINLQPHNKKPAMKVETMNEAVERGLKEKDRWEKQNEWKIDKDGTMESNGYIIQAERLDDDDWILHILEKGWDLNAFVPAYFEACRRAGIEALWTRTNY